LSFTLLSRYAFADGHAEKKGGSDWNKGLSRR
jgi:hypothetical protein